MFFLIKYSKALEEGSFRGRSADFLWMLVFGAPPPPSQHRHALVHLWWEAARFLIEGHGSKASAATG